MWSRILSSCINLDILRISIPVFEDYEVHDQFSGPVFERKRRKVKAFVLSSLVLHQINRSVGFCVHKDCAIDFVPLDRSGMLAFISCSEYRPRLKLVLVHGSVAYVDDRDVFALIESHVLEAFSSLVAFYQTAV